MDKQAYALFKRDVMIGCFFSRSKAVRQVDSKLGEGLFSCKWNGNKKDDYEIVPCTVAYDKLYVIPIKGKRPRMYPSIDALISLLKQNGIKIKKKLIRPTTFKLDTSRGELKGRIIQVK